ncbi:SDR family oxidoreductase [Marinitenerispora sediminis]|uniref:Capsule biosynthesis protein CapD n=1 Tax=Marinitenerispora sediminis TaxID=1931232 RepID=A0A368T7S4_9ACTN|nr:NAD(P)H-binding protein [Marinitenerispora sediminis]RCV56033.1 capsule biosynthesis protein CapD [Marinitenerispora sediminis]RCV60237.1 capsule biosynthesis protein CapD [Marinitenerispora sediminis]RCV60979.1 capsule biosynthesis protein CapD [Marinitenerispora sediminis]
MILVTGATGNIGRELVRQLHAEAAVPLRALTRDPARAAFPDGVEAVEGDLASAASLKPALEGVRSLFLIPGAGAEAEIIEAARHAEVRHVVLVSSITVQTHPHLPATRTNLAAERALRDSGLGWTVLRPTQFASNALWWAESIRAYRTVHAPFGDVGLPAIHPADIAAVARVALTEPGHEGRTYPLTGPERVTPREQVAAIAAALGEAVSFVGISREEAQRSMAAFLGPETADAVLDLMGGDVNDGLLAVHDTVPSVTGTPGRSFREWAAQNAEAFR